METSTEIRLTRRKMLSLSADPVRSAEAISLIYVNDNQPGITREKTRNGFIYLFNGEQVTDEVELIRIRRLVIPPAWQNVWICAYGNGHLQATGLDKRNRKQYRYHPLWNILRNQTKFYHLSEFGKALASIREQLAKDINRTGFPPEKVLATIVSLMQCTCIRVGNSMYEKLYGSFGITTLQDKHVKIEGSSVKFSFKGKKGVHHDISLKSRKLANIVKQCRDIPGKELFQYYDAEGHRHPVDSGMVNNYIREISGGNFTAKDFRTWAGSLHALEAFREIGQSETQAEIKRNIITALDTVARQLGNTRTVCKKYYVHPAIIDHYTNKTLAKYFNTDACEEQQGLSTDEQLLMKVLQDTGTAVIAA